MESTAIGELTLMLAEVDRGGTRHCLRNHHPLARRDVASAVDSSTGICYKLSPFRQANLLR
jgi:hypothetical protein